MVLLLLILVLMVGCNRAAPEVDKTTPAPVATELTNEQYLTSLIDGLEKTSEGFQQLTSLLDEPNKDAAWEAKMNIELEKIRATSLEYLDLKNVPERYSKVHEHMTQAMFKHILAVDSYPVKSEDQNARSFTIAADYMKEGAASIGKAMGELDKIE